MKRFDSFVVDESGAATVDWVALAAAIVVVGLVVVYADGPADTATEQVE